jgi:preprotein translocase SecE subunit
MAKTRAQRKAEQRRRRETQPDNSPAAQSRAQRRTQVPESADVLEAEAAEAGVEIPAPVAEPEAPAPSRADVGRPEQAAEPTDRIGRRAAKRAERERQARAKASATRRAPKAPAVERKRGGVIGFFQSCWAELKKVQWPDRETLVQASGVTVLFIAIAAAYLGALDSLFNFLVQHLL